ncbi:MAG: hypothetical protein WBC91_26255 [Phototrophicaceae bacterium]
MAKKRMSIVEQMHTVWLLRDHTLKEASVISGIPTRTIRKWQLNYEQIKAEYEKYMHDEGIHKLMIAQNRMADKIDDLVNAITHEKIEKAPLNQITSALGVVVDRFIRIHDAKEVEETPHDHTFRIEYYDATTGKVSATPSWAEDHRLDESDVHSSFLWQTLWENRTSEAGHHGNGISREDDLVARTDISDGESRLARPQDDDDERDWYPN